MREGGEDLREETLLVGSGTGERPDAEFEFAEVRAEQRRVGQGSEDLRVAQSVTWVSRCATDRESDLGNARNVP